MKFSEFWLKILGFYEADGIDFEAMYDSKSESIKEDYRTLWSDGVEPEEAYDRLS